MSRPPPPRPEAVAPAPSLRVLARVGPLLVAVTFVLLLAWTWRTWADVLIDFGRELYVPWRLSTGAALQRDIAWFNGPLSAWLNAGIFRIFGASYGVLAWTNALLFALVIALLYRLLVRVSDHGAATAACLLVLLLQGFGQQVGIGNYNWIAPYSHELTHGILLALASLALLDAWRGRRRLGWVAAAGACLGLCFLTKVEAFLAAALASGVHLALLVAREPLARARRSRVVLVFMVAALVPPMLAFAAQLGVLSPGAALRSTLGGWPHVLGGAAQELPFYRTLMGLDRPGELAQEILLWTAGLAGALLPACALALALRTRTTSARLSALAAFVVQALVVGALAIPWSRAGRTLPLSMLILVVAFALALARRRRGAEGSLELALSVLALALLARMGLNPRISHYGFALALPAVALLATALVGWLPATLERRGAAGSVVRAVGLALLVVAAQAYVRTTAQWLERKGERLSSGSDAMRVDARGPYVQATLAELERRLPAEGTLAVLPEGVMVNYLARRVNPTPYVNFMPPELLLFGEERMLAAFEAAPPDAIVLIHKDTSEYGFPLFGRDYGRALMGWVRARYRSVGVMGQPPLQPGTTFGVEVLVRESKR